MINPINIWIRRNRVFNGGYQPVHQTIPDIELLTLVEVAIILRVSTRTVTRFIQRRTLPAYKVGGQWRIHKNDLLKFIPNP